MEKTDEGHPLEFIYGMGMMIPKFEENLKGLSENDTFQFKIEAAEGYGLSDEKNIIELPNSVFEVDGEKKEELFVVGKVIPKCKTIMVTYLMVL
ncbi:MAG: FKBP-type peptidyl-prolyl cis-trans isomerase [Saprospiraceae bacterium]